MSEHIHSPEQPQFSAGQLLRKWVLDMVKEPGMTTYDVLGFGVEVIDRDTVLVAEAININIGPFQGIGELSPAGLLYSLSIYSSAEQYLSGEQGPREAIIYDEGQVVTVCNGEEIALLDESEMMAIVKSFGIRYHVPEACLSRTRIS